MRKETGCPIYSPDSDPRKPREKAPNYDTGDSVFIDNTGHDLEHAVSESLKSLGFEVFLGRDGQEDLIAEGAFESKKKSEKNSENVRFSEDDAQMFHISML